MGFLSSDRNLWKSKTDESKCRKRKIKMQINQVLSDVKRKTIIEKSFIDEIWKVKQKFCADLTGIIFYGGVQEYAVGTYYF